MPRSRGRTRYKGVVEKDFTDNQWERAFSLMEQATENKHFRGDIPPANEIAKYSVQAFWNGTAHPYMLKGKDFQELLPIFELQLKSTLRDGQKLGDFIAEQRTTLDGMESTLTSILGWQGRKGSARSRPEALVDMETSLGEVLGANKWYFAVWSLHRTKQLKLNDDRFGWLFIINHLADRMTEMMTDWKSRPTPSEFQEATKRLKAKFPATNGIHPSVLKR